MRAAFPPPAAAQTPRPEIGGCAKVICIGGLLAQPFRAVHPTLLVTLILVGAWTALAQAASPAAGAEVPAFPPALSDYGDSHLTSLREVLANRIAAEPLNLVATIIFVLAIVHTFLTAKLMHVAHRWKREHEEKLRLHPPVKIDPSAPDPVCFRAELMHFFGEVEAVFGIWVIPLLIAITALRGWGQAAEPYVSHRVHFVEPMFVVVIMCIAATRPVLRVAEQGLAAVASLGGGKPAAWWLSILTVGPLLGSFITEPAAMTICALLLARQFFELNPSVRFRYATLGLLFVNISVGGTLTHFAAPPVLMVAGPWKWDAWFMSTHFGWKALVGIVVANLIYSAIFRREFVSLEVPAVDEEDQPQWSDRTDPVPVWVTLVHLIFLAWTVFTAHQPALFIGGFLFFIAFTAATEHHQNPLSLRPPLLVGFFLGGLVVHGGLQGWWIEPVLARLGEGPLMLSAMLLTAFNDNAAITYLATLVPEFTEGLKYAVVAGAVAGGGLTVIANAPNPAGQSILAGYFRGGVAPLPLLFGALLPTIIVAAALAFL